MKLDEELHFLLEKMAFSLPSLTSNKPCWGRKEKAGLTIVFRQQMNSRKVFSKRMSADSIGVLSTIIENHDEPRGVSHYIAEGPVNDTSKKALGTIQILRKGIPFIYQGQEIGMESKSLNRWRTLMISRPSMATMWRKSWFDRGRSLGRDCQIQPG